MKRLKIFHNSRQSVKNNTGFSPSAGKPEKLLAHLQKQKVPLEIMDFAPVTPADLKLVHEPKYVDGVLQGDVANGFGNRSAEVAASLPWTSGSFVAAALHAWQRRETVASFTSGFHHAHHAYGGGFCTFNGLVVAVMKLKAVGARRIGVLDCDMHYGDGTAALLVHHRLDDVVHFSFGGQHQKAEDWLRELPDWLAVMEDCEVLLYQAGADPYIRDPLGGMLTMEQLQRRDRIVFEWAAKHGIPVAWNLAGGYTSPFSEVLQIHENTVIACLAAESTRTL